MDFRAIGVRKTQVNGETIYALRVAGLSRLERALPVKVATSPGHVWTYMDPARLQRVWQRLVPRSQLLTYIRLLMRRERSSSSPRATMDFRALPPQRRQGISRNHAGPDTRFGKRRSDRFAIFYQSLQLLGETDRSFHLGFAFRLRQPKDWRHRRCRWRASSRRSAHSCWRARRRQCWGVAAAASCLAIEGSQGQPRARWLHRENFGNQRAALRRGRSGLRFRAGCHQGDPRQQDQGWGSHCYPIRRSEGWPRHAGNAHANFGTYRAGIARIGRLDYGRTLFRCLLGLASRTCGPGGCGRRDNRVGKEWRLNHLSMRTRA